GRSAVAYDLDASGAAQLPLEVLVELLTVWGGDDQVPLAAGYGGRMGAGHCPSLLATPPRGIGREQGRRRRCGAQAQSTVRPGPGALPAQGTAPRAAPI